MVWFFYALLSAACLATVDALSKRALSQSDERIVSWVRLAFAAPFLFGILLLVPLPPLDGTFWKTILILLPLELTALVLYIRAIKVSPLSLTIPFLSLTPVFMMFTGWVVAGERVDLQGASGIVMIAIGAYSLHLHTLDRGWAEPFRAILREPGSRLMILVSLIYSLTSVLGKVAIRHSSPEAFAVLYLPLLAVAFAPVVFLGARPHLIQIRRHRMAFLAIGFFEAAMILFHALAIARTEAAYMIAVKRSSLLFSVFYGYLIFGETDIRRRLAGCLLMIAGVAVISMR